MKSYLLYLIKADMYRVTQGVESRKALVRFTLSRLMYFAFTITGPRLVERYGRWDYRH